MGEKEIEEFLTYLAVKRKVSAFTQNQALIALLLLYKRVLQITLGDFAFKHAKKGNRLPVVLAAGKQKECCIFLTENFT